MAVNASGQGSGTGKIDPYEITTTQSKAQTVWLLLCWCLSVWDSIHVGQPCLNFGYHCPRLWPSSKMITPDQLPDLETWHKWHQMQISWSLERSTRKSEENKITSSFSRARCLPAISLPLKANRNNSSKINLMTTEKILTILSATKIRCGVVKFYKTAIPDISS